MGFSMASMFKAILLIVNAFTVLSEKRFLSKFGLDYKPAGSVPGVVDDTGSAKQQIRHLLYSMRLLLKVPLIVTNSLTIAFALIFG
jgi:hypothetical protein